MDLLKRRIIEDGTELGTEVVKVDSFLNHQLDIGLFMAIGKEISRRFGHLGINKILTTILRHQGLLPSLHYILIWCLWFSQRKHSPTP